MLKSKNYELKRLKLIAELTKGESVLDLGYAQMPNPFLTNPQRVGFDLNKPVNSETQYEEEIVGNVLEIKSALHGRSFDTIICGELIEHLENPYELLRDLHSLLNDNGRLVLSTPNPMGFPVFLYELLQSKTRFYSHDHLYYFLPRWVDRLIESTGFSLQEKRSIGLWFPWFVLPSPVILSYQVIYVANKA